MTKTTRGNIAHFEIECDNEAFGPEDSTRCRKADEVARILRAAADRLQERPELAENGTGFGVADANANGVGMLQFFSRVTKTKVES